MAGFIVKNLVNDESYLIVCVRPKAFLEPLNKDVLDQNCSLASIYRLYTQRNVAHGKHTVMHTVVVCTN